MVLSSSVGVVTTVCIVCSCKCHFLTIVEPWMRAFGIAAVLWSAKINMVASEKVISCNEAPHKGPVKIKRFPGLLVQNALFFVPYFFTVVTSVTPFLIDLDQGTTALRMAGAVNGVILALNLIGWLGPHYVKIGCGVFNCAMSALLLTQGHVFSALVLPITYILPAFVFVMQAIYVPSISEIIPGICLSNKSAALSPHWIKSFRVTHILDLTGTTQHPKVPGVTVKQISVKDFLGSQGSLQAVTRECLDFCEMVLVAKHSSNNEQNKNNVLLIHCLAGQSRSAAFFLHYFMSTRGMSLAKAYSFLRKQRPVVDISSDHMAPLRALDKDTR